MRISYNWLKEFLKIDWEAEETAALLTDLGLEVEGIETIESIKGSLQGVLVGEVLTCEKHFNANQLKITTVAIGEEEPLQIVCGAPNVAVGQKVAVATVGTVLYDAEGNPFPIKKGKIRGATSLGMLCAEDELGLGTRHEGILVLNADLKPGTPVSEVFKIESDRVFEIGLTPNRADAMSHFGTARDLRAGLLQKGVSLELISPSVSSFQVASRTLKFDVEVADAECVPRYCGVTLTDVEVGPSPDWIQNKLKAMGLAPINNVVDITNYVLHELGQPLHAFDAEKVKGDRIRVQTLPSGTKFTTLDGVERELHSEDLMICDGDSSPLCIAGVFGGANAGVSEQTNAIFLESAYFDPISIRKTAKRHALNTDASFRFERGIDPNFTKYALKRAAVLITEITGGKIASEITDLYPKKIEDFELFLAYKNVTRLIGEAIPKETIKNILASLEIKIISETEGGLGLTIPSYRVDVQREADLIEEILRVYGYNKVQFSHKLNSSISFSDSKFVQTENTLANQLNALGFFEIMSNSLTKADYVDHFQTLQPANNVQMLNPLSKDLAVLRQTMLCSGLESIAYNINRQNPSLKVYEFGKTYHKFEDKYEEQKHLALFISGSRNKEAWTSHDKPADFFYVKGLVRSLLTRLGVSKLKTKPTKNDAFHEGISLSVGNIKLVDLGVVAPHIRSAFGIKQEVIYVDFDWDKVLKISGQNSFHVKPLPKFPSVKRDLSLLLNREVTFAELYNLAFQCERKRLKEVDLFDVYEGDQLPENKKSYALSFLLQDDKKTLKDKEIDKIMQKLQATFEANLQATLR